MALESRPVIVLLRGINVGGRNKVAMADLRAIAAECGYSDASTYVQSGNLVLPSASGSLSSIARTLHDAIEERAGLDLALILRTADQWADVIAANPFPAAAGDGKLLHVIFLDGPAPDALVDFDAASFAPEELAVRDTEVYLHLPDGMARSKLSQKVGRLPGAATGTVRNWNTVLKLAAMT